MPGAASVSTTRVLRRQVVPLVNATAAQELAQQHPGNVSLLFGRQLDDEIS
jgi:hypothetical protein